MLNSSSKIHNSDTTGHMEYISNFKVDSELKKGQQKLNLYYSEYIRKMICITSFHD